MKNKKTPQEETFFLRRAKTIPAVPLKLRPKAAPSDSSKSYPCNVGVTGAPGSRSAYRLGSDRNRRLPVSFHQTLTLCKVGMPDRLRQCLCNSYCVHNFSTAQWKSQSFLFHKMEENFTLYICIHFPVTIRLTNGCVCALMSIVYSIKTTKEKSSLP